MTVDAHRAAHEIHVREINVIQINKQVPSRLEVGFRILLFIVDKIRDLSLKEPKPRGIAGSDTDHFPPTPARGSLACGAQL
jgi:hypothetical protein